MKKLLLPVFLILSIGGFSQWHPVFEFAPIDHSNEVFLVGRNHGATLDSIPKHTPTKVTFANKITGGSTKSDEVQSYTKLYIQCVNGIASFKMKYKKDSANLERCSASNMIDSARVYHSFIYQDRQTEKNYQISANFLKAKIDSLNAKVR